MGMIESLYLHTLGVKLSSSTKHASSLRRNRTCSSMIIIVRIIFTCTCCAIALHYFITSDRQWNRATSVTTEKFHFPSQFYVSMKTSLT